MNTQDWSPLGWIGWISLQSKGLSRVFSNNHSSKASILWCSAFFTVQLSHPYMITGKTIALTRRTFVGKAMSLLLNMISRLLITFLPRSKGLLISWLQSTSAVILEPQNIKSDTVSPSICHEVVGPDAMIFVFWMLSFKPPFSLSSFTFIKRLFSFSSLSALLAVCKLHKGNVSKWRDWHQAPHPQHTFWDNIGTRWVILGHKMIDVNLEERQISKQIYSLINIA